MKEFGSITHTKESFKNLTCYYLEEGSVPKKVLPLPMVNHQESLVLDRFVLPREGCRDENH
jgi:hypothetical protein